MVLGLRQTNIWSLCSLCCHKRLS